MNLAENEIRNLTLAAIAELGENATPDQVKKVVQKSAEKLLSSSINPSEKFEASAGRIILTAFGLNQVGVVASITNSFSESKCDLQDITQKLLGDFFTLIMIVDITNSPKDMRDIQNDMSIIAERLNIKIYLQHEDIFRTMHRI
ncbi:MAG: ACT domain-containing protein [bacterium]